jgi:3-hydroxyisobutyrate dehydrogenase
MAPNQSDPIHNPKKLRIAYIGLGNMGGALARRLQLSQPLVVFDRNPDAVRGLVDLGAAAGSGLADIAADSDIVMLCLPTSHQVHEVIFGEGGLAAGAKPGLLIIDQTTGDPQATRSMAAQLTPRGITLMDAPVSGGPRGAHAGSIAIMVGAPEALYQRVKPVLNAISSEVFHAGDVGSGQVIKLANNMLHHSQRLLSLEALTLAVKSGVDPHKAAEILLASSGRNYYMEHNLEQRVLAGKLFSGFTLELLLKDVRLATQLGADTGVPLVFGNLVREYYQMCSNELGPGTQVNAVALTIERLACTQLVPVDYTLT